MRLPDGACRRTRLPHIPNHHSAVQANHYHRHLRASAATTAVVSAAGGGGWSRADACSSSQPLLRAAHMPHAPGLALPRRAPRPYWRGRCAAASRRQCPKACTCGPRSPPGCVRRQPSPARGCARTCMLSLTTVLMHAASTTLLRRTSCMHARIHAVCTTARIARPSARALRSVIGMLWCFMCETSSPLLHTSHTRSSPPAPPDAMNAPLRSGSNAAAAASASALLVA